jgi:hypothetical protein
MADWGSVLAETCIQYMRPQLVKPKYFEERLLNPRPALHPGTGLVIDIKRNA